MARQQTQYPVRKISIFGWTADPWALDGEQDVVPPDPILIATAPVVTWTIIPMNGLADDSIPVTDTTTLDACLVNILRTSSGELAYSRTLSLVECFGAEQTTGRQLVDQATVGDLIALGLRALTAGRASALWIFAEGAEVVA